jgi:hypothetical protein
MGPVVVSLNMIEVGRGPECFVVPVEFLHPTGDTVKIIEQEKAKIVVRMNSRITVANCTNVTLEMSDIDRIESNLLPLETKKSTLINESLTMVTQSLMSASVRVFPTR